MPSDFLTLMLDGRVPMTFRLIPPGEFRMGSRGFDSQEEPIHRVKITKSFYIGVYPVTQLQWRTIAETVPPTNGECAAAELVFWNRGRNDYKRDNRAVESMDWHESRTWCKRLHRSSAVRECMDDAGQPVAIAGVDLPTEAEWEYACRLAQTAPRPVCTDTEYNTGDGEAALSATGFYNENSDGTTHDVGGKAPNGIGLHDMHGNVWEWCRDAWFGNAYKLCIDGVTDPLATSSDVGKSEDDAGRVVRGGSWGSSARFCRAASRGWDMPGNRDSNQGFRVCLYFGPTGTEVTSEPVPVDAARRQADAKSEDSGGEVTEVDLSSETRPKRSDGKKF